MKQLLVYADFHFLPTSQKLGILNYDRVRGNEVFSFSYDQTWPPSMIINENHLKEL